MEKTILQSNSFFQASMAPIGERYKEQRSRSMWVPLCIDSHGDHSEDSQPGEQGIQMSCFLRLFATFKCAWQSKHTVSF